MTEPQEERKSYTEKQMQETVDLIEGSIVNCEKVRLKLKKGTSSFSLNTNRIRALTIAKAVLTHQENGYSKEELEQAVVQITSIRNKSTAGFSHAKAGSATYTRFQRLITAMDIALDYLHEAIEKNLGIRL